MPGFRFLALITIVTILLAGACNLRENALLPPGLDPKDYVAESTIRVYSNHLIKSDNDKSFLYIPKESIADTGLWYGDVISFSKRQALTERDSLAFADGTIPRTDTYSLVINRGGTDILLDSIPDFATIYTDLNSNKSTLDTQYVQNGWRLSANDIQVSPYGSGRCFFPIDGNGDIALLDLKGNTTLTLEPTGKDIQTLIVTQDDYVYTWFPDDFMTGPATLSLQNNLSQAEATYLASVFPGFALNTKVISLETANSASTLPIVRYRKPATKAFGTQWVRMNGAVINTWPAGEDTWVQEPQELVSFLGGNGKHFLATPMDGQDSIELPLDGSFSQLFLPGIWLDLRSVTIANTILKLDLSPEVAQLKADYFSGRPFTLSSDAHSFSLQFTQGGSILQTLPDEAWIEFGFSGTTSDPMNSRLFSAYRSGSVDRIGYKTYAGTYDASHFSYSNGWTYAGYSGSGTYLFGQASESASSTVIPCFKADTWVHTAKADYSWSDTSLPCASVTVEHGASVNSTHPWLSGYPFTLASTKSICRVTAQDRKKGGAELPEGFFMEYTSTAPVKNVLNVSPSDTYPRLAWYKASTTFAHNTFVYSDGRIRISPAWTGYLIDGAKVNVPTGAKDLMLYSRMLFDYYDWEVIQDNPATLASGTVLRVTQQASFTDTYGVFASQYDLSPLAPVYKYQILNNSTFYTSFQPYIRLRLNNRTENLLFSVSDGDYYRVYSYNQREEANGWNFAMADGHAAFYLPYDAEFGVVHDNAIHTVADRIVNTSIRDFHNSLYQAQFVLPNEFIGNTIPIGAHVTLNSNPVLPPEVTARSAIGLQLRNAQLVPMAPNFFNILTATRLPYIYIPVQDYDPGENIRLFYRGPAGNTTELTRVDAFGDDLFTQFIMVGNCAVCFVNNPGLFYTTN
jgi:hypothetical protein